MRDNDAYSVRHQTGRVIVDALRMASWSLEKRDGVGSCDMVCSVNNIFAGMVMAARKLNQMINEQQQQGLDLSEVDVDDEDDIESKPLVPRPMRPPVPVAYGPSQHTVVASGQMFNSGNMHNAMPLRQTPPHVQRMQTNLVSQPPRHPAVSTAQNPRQQVNYTPDPPPRQPAGSTVSVPPPQQMGQMSHPPMPTHMPDPPAITPLRDRQHETGHSDV